MVPKRTKTFNWEPKEYATDLCVREENGERFYGLEKSDQTIWMPSITTILGYFKKQAIMEWRDRVGHDEAKRISGTAARRGTVIHRMVEQYISNHSMETITYKASLPEIEMFNNMIPTLDRIDNILMQEKQLYSTRLGVAGRCDLIAEFDGVLSIIDFKTSRREKKKEYIQDYLEQAAGYSAMYHDMNLDERVINQCVIIIAHDDANEPQVFVEKTLDYIDPLYEKIRKYKERKCVQSIIL